MAKDNTKKKKENSLQIEGMSLKIKLIVTIVPIVAILLIALTVITTLVSRSIILERSNSEMAATLGEHTNYISAELEDIRAQANTVARMVAGTYESASFEGYGNALAEVVEGSDLVLGAGLWFEPNTFDKDAQYYGPYWYKNTDSNGNWDGKDLILTWDYSNAEYDYFSQEYYTNAKTLPTATITDPYYDPSSGLVMASCSAPIKTISGDFVGCITVDIMLTSISDQIGSIRVGETGTLFLIDGNGNYIYHPAFPDAIKDEMNITASTEMGDYVQKIMSNDEGEGSFKWEGTKRLLFWDKVPDMTWKIGLTLTEDELLKEVNTLMYVSIIVCLLAIVLTTSIIIYQASGIAKAVAVVADSLAHLREGEFVRIVGVKKRTDEIGLMTEATNDVIDKLDDIVSSIKESAMSVGSSSEELSDMANQISQTAEDVSNAVQEIASGATQQADEIQSASENVGLIGDAVNDVQNSTGDLSSTANKMKEASEVSSRSLSSLQESSQEMTAKIDEISKTIQATEEAVTNISSKVEGITSIATQTNLLSLNASIEAARAGEAGKGFAVVAEEIGQLAENSKQLADDIRVEMEMLLTQAKAAVDAAEDVRQGNVDQQAALGETLIAVNGMLEDIGSTVGGVKLISAGADTCESSKNAVVDTMSALSAISEENAASSQETGASMQELSATVTTLAGSATSLKEIAEKLNEEMQFFKS
ncbi:MAG: Cache 3/Cache 2 fusion domain-containing protein [Butyrivibrio sp.]|uniref:methyl-accepting chemotaxis protein n=1 Tax=Butyrivibrio sp. TaxID=28121 RepID=UPI001B04F584|nr:methyl-accepting chemotaxis protein [Butyrivibrio sp.]MBO6241563.1 Cache 3/Cache 2 fusion domain-containing protein [Butyrivibrio sp.]